MRSMFRSVSVALVAVLALSAVAVSSASASGGPEWLVNGSGLSGAKATTSSNVGEFHLEHVGFAGEVVCKKESGSGEIKGGNPGTGTATITFSECAVEGKPTCVASSGKVKGVLAASVKTALAYPNAEGSEAASLEALVPVGLTGHPNEFFELEFSGEGCGLVKGLKYKVEATGSEINEPAFGRRCGILAEVGKISGGAFVSTKAGEEAVEGALAFRTLTKANIWESGHKTLTRIECGSSAGGSTLGERGLLKLEAEKERFGWKL